MMNYIKNITKSFLFATLAVACVSCDDDDVVLGSVPVDNFVAPAGNPVYLTDDAGRTDNSSVEFRNSATVNLYVNSQRPVANDVNVTFAIDPEVLAAFNAANGTSYKAFPQSLVDLKGGKVTLAEGAVRSASLPVALASDAEVNDGETYAIALRLTAEGGVFGEGKDSRVILVRDLSGIPTAAKTYNGRPGTEIISFFEVNDVNPLTALTYTLANTKEPLIDMVVLFAANINYDSSTQRAYIQNNENVQAILDNREKYLKPLQERGIKVVLGILGNHDRAGVSNLSDEAAQAFAQEVKAMCDAYELDGINLDDEYTAHIYPAPAGFVNPSSEALSRLFYEIKKAQPERLTVHYLYSQFISPRIVPVTDLVTGEVKQPGEFIDYAVNDYGRDYDIETYVPGISKARFGRYSQEFARGYFATEDQLVDLRDGEYNVNMIFSLNPFRWGELEDQEAALDLMARTLYGQPIARGTFYPKDWN